MTAVAAGRGIVARQTTDRTALRTFLERDRLFAAYAVCDLDEREFGRARWALAMAGTTVVAAGMEYTGPTPQSMFVLGQNDGIAAILRDVLRPRAAYISAAAAALPAVAQSYRVEPGPSMVRMVVDRASFRPYPAPVERLLPVEVGELNRLYQLGFAAWLPSGAVAEGVYFGVRAGGRLVAAAGTHVISREARMGVVGNVMTHLEYRNRGLAKAVTSAVTAELLRYCDDVVLNVRSDNPPAIAAYRALGYEEHRRFEERLIRRTAPSWPAIPAPFRRFFGSRSPAEAPLTIDQAHRMTPPEDASAEALTADAADPVETPAILHKSGSSADVAEAPETPGVLADLGSPHDPSAQADPTDGLSLAQDLQPADTSADHPADPIANDGEPSARPERDRSPEESS